MAHSSPAISGTNSNGNFQALKGENCTLHKIRGVKILEDSEGRDILKLLTSSSGSSKSSDATTLSTLSSIVKRIEVIENYLQNLTITKGEDGAVGPQGPRGKDGAKTMSALSDVNLDGLEDGATLVWSAKVKKWVVGVEEN